MVICYFHNMPRFPFPIRFILWLTNLFMVNPRKPLNETRRRTNYFMRMMNRRAALKFPDFYSEQKTGFTSKEGHEIRLKIYTPVKTSEQLPVWVYFHGGGFAWGAYDARSNFLKAIATKANCIVASVAYRLSPEYPFPAGVNDCYETALWVSQNAKKFGGDKSRIAVGGESAGGNLSAAVAQMARDKGAPEILHQTLLYPTVDATLTHASIEKYASGYLINKEQMHNFRDSYLPNESDRKNPYASPLFGSLQNLPPALVITAQCDPLVDEGNLYAGKLKQNGVPVVHKEYENMIHDFVLLMPRFLPEAREAMDLIAQEVKKAFGQTTAAG